MAAVLPATTVATSSFFDRALPWSARAWFGVAVLGQWLFAAYILVVFGGALVQGQPEAINRTDLITGYVAGDGSGNAMLFGHVLAGALLSAGGVLQLLPWLRQRLPTVHRWNGRVFLLLAIAGAISGLLLTWVRGSRLSEVTAWALSLDGLLILIAAGMAWRLAVQRRFAAHRRWAIRAFLLVSAVWAMRLGFMAWVILNQGPRGMTTRLDGPFDLFWAFGCFLLPLAIAELYFLAERHASWRGPATVVLTLGAAVSALGVFGAYTMMWAPHL